MSVLALSIELGAQPKTFAADLSRALDAELVDLGPFERSIGYGREISQPAPAARRPRSLPAGWPWRRSDPLAPLKQRILSAATRDRVVIASWCAPLVLAGIERVAAVRLQAPVASRARLVRHELCYPSEDVARLEIEFDDATAAALLHDHFAASWTDPSHFAVVINAGSEQQGFTMAVLRDLALGMHRAENAADKAIRNAMIECRIQRTLERGPCHDPTCAGRQA